VQSVLDIGETMPFFADSRVIVIENSGLFKKCPEDFEKKLQALPESTHIIFVENEVDKRNRLYKWIGKAGYVSEMNTPDEKMLLGWVKGLCKKEEKQMEDSVIIYFVEHMGTDMLLLKNELEKLFSYCYGKSEITIEDVRQVCVSQAEDKLFDMLDAIGNHNQEKALLLYHDLLALREPAMRVLYMFTRHFHILMQVNALSEEGKDNKTIASACGIPPFLVKKYAAQAGKYTYQQLRCMVEQCQDTDERIKTGRVQDTVGVELLIVEFSGK
jgi:DNA polymerase-3 subunit delta